MTEGKPVDKFLPAFFVDVVQPGKQFQAGSLPLHLTLFPPIEQAYDPAFGEVARSLINPMVPFQAVVGEPDQFGSELEVITRANPVWKIRSSVALLALHNALGQVLDQLPHDRQFLPYSPHISVRRDTTVLSSGDSFNIAGLSILSKRAHERRWTVVDKIGLKGETTA